jgi:uncharacterized protein
MSVNTAEAAGGPDRGAGALDAAGAGERLDHVDAIRGLALFGVLLVNLAAHAEIVMSPAQVDALPWTRADAVVGFLVDVLWEGKAQALFSMLFGFGFALMMGRMQRRRAGFDAIYLRRLLLLALVGWLHLYLVFLGDILHLYATMGLLLLLVRGWPTQRLLMVGLLLSLFAWPLFYAWVVASAPPGGEPPLMQAWEAGREIRSVVFLSADYPSYVAELWRANRDEYFATALGPTYAAYVFGRFLLGYWVARSGWLTDPAAHGARLARALPWLLGMGFALALAGFGAQRLLDESSPLRLPAEFAIEASKLLLAAGYALLVLRAFRAARGGAFARALAAVGRMALTNYLAHSLVYLFVLYGFGLALLPLAGPTFCLGLAIAVLRCRWRPAAGGSRAGATAPPSTSGAGRPTGDVPGGRRPHLRWCRGRTGAVRRPRPDVPLVSGPGTTTLRATLPVPGSVDAASRDACAAGAVRRAGPGVDRKPTMSNETGVNAMKAKFSLYALGLATALLCSPAMAGSWGTSGYTGLGFIDEDELDDDAFSSSTSLVWRWNDTLGIEGGYTRFGDFEGDFDTIEGTGKAELGIDGFTLGLNFLSRTGGDWFITGRAGVWAWDSELKVEVPGSARLDLDSDGNDFYIGAGIGYMFSERFGAGLGGTYYSVDVDDSTTGLYIIGVNTTYTF